MDISELVKAAQRIFGVKEVTVDDIRRIKMQTADLKKRGLSECEAATQAASEIFSGGKRQGTLVEGDLLKKSWDLSWFRANSSEFLQAIDDYFRNNP